VRDQYRIAPDRVWVQATGNAASLGLLTVFRQRQMYRGVALVNPPPVGKVPENDPEHRLLLHLSAAKGGAEASRLERSAKSLRELGYPTVFQTTPTTDGRTVSAGLVEELARWADCLDRI
jgi:hypothetical protein